MRKTPYPRYGEKVYINNEHYYRKEAITGAEQHAEVTDWEWDGKTWSFYFIYNGIRFTIWTDVYNKYVELTTKNKE